MTSTIKTKDHLVLLGDSIIDNGVYVDPKEPCVSEQVALEVWDHGYRVTKLALDGAVVENVYHDGAASSRHPYRHQFDQIAGLESPPTKLILSAGGNDILGISRILDHKVGTVQDALRLLQKEAAGFSSRYGKCLDRLKSLSLPLWVLTIYDPCFRNRDRWVSIGQQPPHDLDNSRNQISHTAISIFNSEIYLQANRRGIPVIDLRTIFTDPKDYANPIEPSAIGGAKLAKAISTRVLAFDNLLRRAKPQTTCSE